MNDAFEMLRAANPVPEFSPPPLQRLRARLELEDRLGLGTHDLAPGTHDLARGTHDLGPGAGDLALARRSPPWGRPLGRVLAAVPVAIAVAVALVALISLGHRAGTGGNATATLALGAPVPAAGVSTAGLRGRTIPGTAAIVAHIQDPNGGLAWGLRTVRTTTGQLCMQIGRLQAGRLGVIGQDGSFGDDGRFHPYASAAFAPGQCSLPHATRRPFDYLASQELDASAGTPAITGGCRVAAMPAGVSPCPRTHLRLVFYGLIGPEGGGVDYFSPSGARGFESFALPPSPTGAYMWVLPLATHDCAAGQSGDACPIRTVKLPLSELLSGARATVQYEGQNRVCRLASRASRGEIAAPCRYGYGAPIAHSHIRVAQVASTVVAGAVTAGPNRVRVSISFTARLATGNRTGFYGASLTPPPGCPGGVSRTSTQPVRVGQHVTVFEQFLRACPGRYTGAVALEPITGPPAVPVGQASFTVR